MYSQMRIYVYVATPLCTYIMVLVLVFVGMPFAVHFFLFFSKRRNNLVVRYQIRILLVDTYKIELSRRAKKTTSGITVGTFNSWKSGELLPFL